MALPFDLSLSPISRSRRNQRRRKKSLKAQSGRTMRPRCCRVEQLEQRYLLASICGTKFHDYDGDGIRDTDLIKGEAPDVVFIVDVSDTSKNSLGGSPVGDVNTDGRSNKILDAELKAYIELNDLLVQQGLGSVADVSVIVYGESAVRLDMDPASSAKNADQTGGKLATKAGATTGGLRDVDEILKTVLVGGFKDDDPAIAESAGYAADFEDALRKATATFADLGTPAGSANLIFLAGSFPSDGSNDDGNDDPLDDHWDEAEGLAGINVHAFGVGVIASIEPDALPAIQKIDAGASVFLDTEQMLTVFQGGEGGSVTYTDPPMGGVTIQGGGVTTTTSTDPDPEKLGTYCLNDVPDGQDITITEPGQTGWAQTTTNPVTAGTTNHDIGNIEVLDFGDAPDDFPVVWKPLAIDSGAWWTLPSQGGARHIPGTIWLGDPPNDTDTEQWGANSDDAKADDDTGDDEDGVAFPLGLVPGAPVAVDVTVGGTSGFLNAWIDFNGNGSWWDAGEQIFTNEPVDVGKHRETSNVIVPVDFDEPKTYARFRISSTGGDGIVGIAADGEVEDYALGSISGVKYSDLGGVVGDRDAGEPGLAGWRIYADVNGNKQYDAGEEPSDVTDTSGNYNLYGLLESAGSPYVLREEGPTGWKSAWQQTEPGPDNDSGLSGPLGAGVDLTDQDFGNHDEVDPEWVSFDPPDETGAAGEKWKVRLDKNLVIEFNEQVKLGTSGHIRLFLLDGTEVEDFDVSSTSLVTGSGTTQITINPTDDLDPSTEYHVLVDLGAIVDLSGNPYAGFTDVGQTGDAHTWNFSTVPIDFGDAPDSSINASYKYPVTGATAARHPVAGPFLGTVVPDGESGGQPSRYATGDGADDEDGVTFSYGGVATANMTIYTSSIAPMNAWVDAVRGGTGSAQLDAWIDFDGSGSWEHPGEHLFGGTSAPLTGASLMFTVPQGLASDTTFARFRVSSAGNLSPGGPAVDGEVEDYQITIAQAATVSGSKLFDSDDDGVVGGSEDTTGLGGWTIYQDLNDSGGPDAGEPSTVTSGTAGTLGEYTLPIVPDRDYHVREVLKHGWKQTVPPSGSHQLNLPAGGSASSIDFGNFLHPDFGDAPSGYPVTLAEDGARHIVKDDGPTLGAKIDSEPDGQHSDAGLANKDDTDNVGYVDEDGVVFSPLFVSPSFDLDGWVTVTVANTGGSVVYLNAWIDFDGLNGWDDDVVEQIFDDHELTRGDDNYKESFKIPAGAKLGNTVARFRISTVKLSSTVTDELNIGQLGEAPNGEVEDHVVTLENAATIQGTVWRDGNENGVWDEADEFKNLSRKWDVYLDLDDSTTLDDGEPFAGVELNGGAYTLTYAPRDEPYIVRLAPPTGWGQSYPDPGGANDGTVKTNVSIEGAAYKVLLDTPGQTIGVVDGDVNGDVDFLGIQVIPNRSPVLGYIGDQTTDEGDPVTVSVFATDADGDETTFEVEGSKNTAHNASAIELGQEHNFQAAPNEYFDWNGQHEKWFLGIGGWYYILPNGEVYDIDGELLATLHDGAGTNSVYWADLTRLYGPRPYDYTAAQLAQNLDALFGFYGEDSEQYDQQGLGEKYFRGDNGTPGDTADDPWYHILPDGSVYVGDWTVTDPPPLTYTNTDGDEVKVRLGDIVRKTELLSDRASQYSSYAVQLYDALPPLTEPFADAVADDPNKIIDDQDVAKLELSNDGELTITPAAGFRGGTFSVTVTVTDGQGGLDSETFTVTVVAKPNTPPDLQEIQDETTDRPVNIDPIPLTATDADGDSLAFTAYGFMVDPLELKAKQLDEQYGFYAGSSDYRNYSGQYDERFFMGADGWYFILPDGRVYAWTSFDVVDNSDPLDTLDGSFHADLSKVYDAADKSLGTELAGDVLTIVDSDPVGDGNAALQIKDNSFSGSIIITVTVDDGRGGTDSETFTVTLEAPANNPPVLAAIGDRTVSRTPSQTSISLSATDADGDTMYWTPDPTASTGDPDLQEVRELDEQYGFYEAASDYYDYTGNKEKFFRGSVGWYFIYPNTAETPTQYDVHAWANSFAGSLTSGPLASLDVKYYDDLTLLCEPPAAQDQAMAAKAQQLDTDYNFRLINDDYSQVFYNFRDEEEKYFIGADDGKDYWYFIVPDGSIYKWAGSIDASIEAGALDTLNSTYHTQLNLLIEPQAPPTVTLVDNGTAGGTSTANLTINWPDNFDGDIYVTVNVNDNIDSDSETFAVTVPAAGGEALGSRVLPEPPEHRWQNQFDQLNVNADTNSVVSASDALMVINYLNANGAGALPALAAPPEIDERFVDVNGDGNCTALDAMIVINYINARTAGGEGEGESVGTAVAAAAVTETVSAAGTPIEAVAPMQPVMATSTFVNPAVGLAHTSAVTTNDSLVGADDDIQRPAQQASDADWSYEMDELEDVLATLADDLVRKAIAEQPVDELFAELA